MAKNTGQRQYIARGTIELRGVDFYITAESEEDARAKAKAGEYDSYEDNGAETFNWEINPGTVKENE